MLLVLVQTESTTEPNGWFVGCSGSTTDRRNAMTLLASNYENDPIDVLTGDWMSEGNMTVRAGSKMSGELLSTPSIRNSTPESKLTSQGIWRRTSRASSNLSNLPYPIYPNAASKLQ